jgi:hypothetical protein
MLNQRPAEQMNRDALTIRTPKRYPKRKELLIQPQATCMPATIDVSGLPEQVVEDIQRLVQSIRVQLAEPAKPASPPVSLPVWEGVVLGRLERRELYDDAE